VKRFPARITNAYPLAFHSPGRGPYTKITSLCSFPTFPHHRWPLWVPTLSILWKIASPVLSPFPFSCFCINCSRRKHPLVFRDLFESDGLVLRRDTAPSQPNCPRARFRPSRVRTVTRLHLCLSVSGSGSPSTGLTCPAQE